MATSDVGYTPQIVSVELAQLNKYLMCRICKGEWRFEAYMYAMPYAYTAALFY